MYTLQISDGDPKPVRVLVVDDSPADLELIAEGLACEQIELLPTHGPDEARRTFAGENPRVVIIDLHTTATAGMQLMAEIRSEDASTDILLIGERYSAETAVQAIQAGACDYLPRPLEIARLRARVERMVEAVRLRERTLQLDNELVRAFNFEGIVGRSPAMLDVFATIRKIAPHFQTALVTGATGTGKELVARALHRFGPASQKTFAACNCSALPDTLLETELFGYVRGAFTGASQDKIGLFEFANGGTVFLDEIGDLSTAGQAKLLRVLQNKEITRVGSPAVRKIEVRVIAATNSDLRAMVAEKRFREDLYYRLCMVEIQLPPLASRKEDLPLLQRHFVEKFSSQYHKTIKGISRPAAVLLSRYHWPGNVRELENVLGKACMVAAGPVIEVSDLPVVIRQAQGAASEDQAELVSFEEVTRRHLFRVMEAVGGDKVRAAQILGISRSTLYSMLAKYTSAGAGKDC